MQLCYLCSVRRLAPPPTQTQGGRRGREGRRAAKRKRRRKETRGRCPWGRGRLSRRSLVRVRRGRWGRGGCWRSSDLKRRETANQSTGITTSIRLDQSEAGVVLPVSGLVDSGDGGCCGCGVAGVCVSSGGVCVPGCHVCVRVQLLQRRGEAGVSTRASHGEWQASQRIRDPQS